MDRLMDGLRYFPLKLGKSLSLKQACTQPKNGGSEATDGRRCIDCDGVITPLGEARFNKKRDKMFYEGDHGQIMIAI